ncbi:MAG TPA: hypothetical protein VKB87_13310 [Myxococcaceae bacterium]|nr:hypothetical protein [Myxococcaceae bacterium]
MLQLDTGSIEIEALPAFGASFQRRRVGGAPPSASARRGGDVGLPF